MQNLVRSIDLSFTTNKSCFLFGPRQTGKSTLLKNTFPDSPYFNLLNSELFLKYSKRPSVIREEILSIKDKSKPIIIDEIQKIPLILDEVHFLIEEGYRFILTGSSSRKLKRGAANLLGGRAREKHLFPFTSFELKEFNLEKIINHGTLPSIYFSDEPYEDLASYSGTYLKEEIQAEGLIRNLPYFTKFLELASICNTEQINYSSIASDIGVSAKTIKNYFEILEDTLIGELLVPYSKTVKRKAVTIPKFYFFDIGVANNLAGRHQIETRSELFGKCFEHFIYCEIRSFLSYSNDKRKLTYWRSTSLAEVDFIIGDDVAIEVKGTELVTSKHLKGLISISEEITFKHLIVVSLDSHERILNHNIQVLPYKVFLKKLWSNQL